MFVQRLVSAAVVTLFAAPIALLAPSATAGPSTIADCPAVAIVAARGSEQSEFLDPTVYGQDSIYISNGYESENIRGFLHYAEQRHVERHGTSLLAGVPVLALDEGVYPAALPIPALADDDEKLNVLETTRRAGALLYTTPPHVLVTDATRGLRHSLRTGMDSALPFLASYEAETSCRPDYLLIGYSQGAIVLTAQEQALASQGRLAGSLYLGNPLLKPGDTPVAGNPRRGGGMLSPVPTTYLPVPAAGTPRLNYCVAGDFACDLTIGAAVDSLGSQGGKHADYFLGDQRSEHDAYVADVFAEWIATYNRGA